MAQNFKIGKFELEDDGTYVRFKVNGTTMFTFNRTSGILDSITASAANLAGGLIFENRQISCGTNGVYIEMSPITADLNIYGQPIFSNPPSMPAIKLINNGTDDTCGSGTWSAMSPDPEILTTMVSSTSKIFLTPKNSMPAGSLYVSSISDGVHFTVGCSGLAGSQDFDWFIVNPV